MKFVYRYQTSGNETREETIKARDRQDVYAQLKKRGIKPMSVVQCPLTAGEKVVRGLVWAGGVALAMAVVVGLMFASAAFGRLSGGKNAAATHFRGQDARAPRDAARAHVRAPEAPKGKVARPLARQAIRGDRARLEKAIPGLFEHPSEKFLAAYAEPGRRADAQLTDEIAGDVPAALKVPVMVYDDELTECVDLKRIVAGMKNELRAYLADGGTVAEYAEELAKRQAEELEYRQKIEEKVYELAKTATQDELYAAWLKADAALKSWGIGPMAMPRQLQGYQPDWDFDE